MDMGLVHRFSLVHRAVCLVTPQLSLVLIARQRNVLRG